MYKKLKIVSLFSGIGGFEEGLKQSKIPFEVVFASEIDKFAQQSYSSNFNNKNLFGDIKNISEETIPNHDLLCAGFPCQSFSIAGKKQGFQDTRGTLFFDVARILKAKRPKFVLLENVKNLINHDSGATFKIIINTLIDLNYSVDFTVINSVESGLPQNRERTYILGIYDFKKMFYNVDNRNNQTNKLKKELNKKIPIGLNFFEKIKFNNTQKFLCDVISKEVDNRYYFMDSSLNEYINTINKTVFDVVQQTKIIKLFDLPKSIHNDLERQRRVYSITGISPTVLARADSTKILLNNNNQIRIRKLTPYENFYIQGYSSNFVKNIKNTGMSVAQMYKQSGNAVSPPVIAEIIKTLTTLYTN